MFYFIRLKKVLFISIIFLVSLFAFLTGANKIIYTSSSAIITNTIVIDAGHGEPDGGAESSTGIKEAYLNLQVAQKLEELLIEEGYNVIMTRRDENNIGDKDKQSTIRQAKVSDINNRIKIVNESNADILISIHMNKFEQTKYYGWQIFYHKSSEKGKILAESIKKGIDDNINRENNRAILPINNIKLIDQSKVPAVVVECGFLSNTDDLRLLQDETYQYKLAEGILSGINKYYQDM